MIVLPGTLLFEQEPLADGDTAAQAAEIRARLADAAAAAEAWMAGQGMDPWEIVEWEAHRRVRRGYYHDEFGFVPRGWAGEGARLVVTVAIPEPEVPDVPPDPQPVEA